MKHYYNEFDPKAAAWLRELIAQGHLPQGDVDERSIEDVVPSDLAGYRSCHFFAGIGGWAYALRLAGWPDDQPVWTGSCPCQPFSTAGKGAGFADERHLWPAWAHLIAQCRPATIFGEQVASKAADPWIDLVCNDLEGMGYAFGCVPFPAAGVSAPHIRDRNYWVADTEPHGCDRAQIGRSVIQGKDEGRMLKPEGCSAVSGLANLHSAGRSARSEGRETARHGQTAGADSSAVGMADALHAERRTVDIDGQDGCDGQNGGRSEAFCIAGTCGEVRIEWPSPLHGFWADADWLLCRDGKWRPVEPGTFPLAHGLPARVVRLRGYGNAIVPQQAAEMIRAVMETLA